MNPYFIYRAFVQYRFYLLFAAVFTIDAVTQEPNPDPYAEDAFRQGYQGNPHQQTGDFFRAESLRFKGYQEGPINLTAREQFFLGQLIRALEIQRQADIDARQRAARHEVRGQGNRGPNRERAETQARRDASTHRR